MSNPLTAAILFSAPLAVALAFWLLALRDRRLAGDPASPGFFRRNGPVVGAFLLAATAFWILFMIVWPMLYMVDYSFHRKLPPTRRGGPDDVYTLENYWYFVYGSTRVFTNYNWVHINAFWQTIAVSVVITVANFAICYPLAYYMAQVAKPGRLRVLLLLLIVPYWVNEILRAFAFMVLFGTGGTINKLLLAMGAISAPIDFIGQNVALYSGLTYAYLLLMVFPLYNAIESLDHNQIEAARDLGAPWWHIHLHVVMPFAKPGIASAARSSSCCPRGPSRRPSCSAGRRRCGSRRSSTTASTRPSTGSRARPTRSSCSSPASPS